MAEITYTANLKGPRGDWRDYVNWLRNGRKVPALEPHRLIVVYYTVPPPTGGKYWGFYMPEDMLDPGEEVLEAKPPFKSGYVLVNSRGDPLQILSDAAKDQSLLRLRLKDTNEPVNPFTWVLPETPKPAPPQPPGGPGGPSGPGGPAGPVSAAPTTQEKKKPVMLQGKNTGPVISRLMAGGLVLGAAAAAAVAIVIAGKYAPRESSSLLPYAGAVSTVARRTGGVAEVPRELLPVSAAPFTATTQSAAVSPGYLNIADAPASLHVTRFANGVADAQAQQLRTNLETHHAKALDLIQYNMSEFPTDTTTLRPTLFNQFASLYDTNRCELDEDPEARNPISALFGALAQGDEAVQGKINTWWDQNHTVSNDACSRRVKVREPLLIDNQAVAAREVRDAFASTDSQFRNTTNALEFVGNALVLAQANDDSSFAAQVPKLANDTLGSLSAEDKSRVIKIVNDRFGALSKSSSTRQVAEQGKAAVREWLGSDSSLTPLMADIEAGIEPLVNAWAARGTRGGGGAAVDFASLKRDIRERPYRVSAELLGVPTTTGWFWNTQGRSLDEIKPDLMQAISRKYFGGRPISDEQLALSATWLELASLGEDSTGEAFAGPTMPTTREELARAWDSALQAGDAVVTACRSGGSRCNLNPLLSSRVFNQIVDFRRVDRVEGGGFKVE